MYQFKYYIKNGDIKFSQMKTPKPYLLSDDLDGLVEWDIFDSLHDATTTTKQLLEVALPAYKKIMPYLQKIEIIDTDTAEVVDSIEEKEGEILKLEINDRAAKAIKNNTKRVEIRANKNDKYKKLKNGDVIQFSSNYLGVFYVKVKEVNYYKTLEELFTLEGTKYTTSSTDDKEEAINNVNKISDYKEVIKEKGVFAIHIEYLHSENNVWEELYTKAKNIRFPHHVSGMIEAGAVGAAILTKNHNIYTGVCIDTASSLGMCAERNAIANMITNGENEIVKLVCVDSQGKVGYPCGACREYLMQLSSNSKNIEILKDEKTKETVKLEELLPGWWGKDRV